MLNWASFQQICCCSDGNQLYFGLLCNLRPMMINYHGPKTEIRVIQFFSNLWKKSGTRSGLDRSGPVNRIFILIQSGPV